MIALIDLDSKIYQAVYRIVSFNQMREAITTYGKKGAKQWLMEEVYNEGINRLENELLKMQDHLQSIFFEEIESYELYITTCSNNFRHKIYKNYKANRKKNGYVWLIREHYKHNGAISSDTLEADDLIYDRAKELGKGKYIVVSPDKDLKTIGGYYWSYYKQNAKDKYGNVVLDEHDSKVKEYKQTEVMLISDLDASFLFYEQMLVGDKVDNISGITPITKEFKQEVKKELGLNIHCRVGVVTANKILKESKNFFITVAREYLVRNQKDMFWVNYKLLHLGSKTF